jgi:hypothetical protein
MPPTRLRENEPVPERANADGDLPLEFDGLVHESFAPVLASEREPAATT